MAEMTCPKCGTKYFGIGCPDCDYPPVPPDPNEAKRQLLFGIIIAAVGLWIVIQYFRIAVAHDLPVLAAGIIFSLVGIHLMAVPRLYRADSRLCALMGVFIAATFCWLACMMIISDKPFQSGIPFIPDSWNQNFAKTLVGIGALM